LTDNPLILLLWVLPGAIAIRFRDLLVPRSRTADRLEIDQVVTYLIASVPVYGLVIAVSDVAHWISPFMPSSDLVTASRRWFVLYSWPIAAVCGGIAAMADRYVRRSLNQAGVRDKKK
jgi:hypothetical protein